ncbi:MAG: aminotransferase class IV [candidate division Zixibacteria bacterium]|nr:aminotransferase class IV [candidate division Zixibacteria bacterium]
MKIVNFIDGKKVPKSEARISIFDNSLFYADGLFETFMAFGDNIIFLKNHLKRLKKGAELINLNIPVSEKQLSNWLNKANQSNPAHIKKIRLTITAGESAFWAGKSGRPKVIIIVTDHKIPTTPFRLLVSPYRIDHASPFRNVKTLSFIIEMTSRKHAYSSKYDDAILLSRTGYVAETTSANIFWVKKGILYTPPLEAGCLDGMIRKHTIEIAKSNDISIVEKRSRLKTLLNADEVFVSSSLKLIIPVSTITTIKTYRYKTGVITKRLGNLLLKYINSGG